MSDTEIQLKKDKMERLISDFRLLRAEQRTERVARMRRFILDFDLCARREADFNVFALLGVKTDEVRHSRFLAWLLNSRSDHRQGNMFLRAFVDLCDIAIPPDVLNKYHVRTESSGSEAIIDIMACRRTEFLIYLENKILAPEGSNQVDREFRDMQRAGATLRVPEERQFAVFLTPDGRAPVSGDATRWITVSYREIAAEFDKLLPRITVGKVSFVLGDWIRTISAFGGLQ